MPYEAIEHINEQRVQSNARSELAQEIISQKPGFLEQWALLIFLLILILLLALSWMITYPDIVQASATLTAADAPREIIPEQEGRLIKLFVQNKEMAKQNQVLGWLESTASHAEILELSALVDSSIHLLNKNQIEKPTSLFTKNYTNIGGIQHDYHTCITTLKHFNDDVLNGFYDKKKTVLMNDLQSLKREIDDWKKKYILQSPVNGKISYTIQLHENQFLQAGKPIGYITPNDAHFYAEAYLPQSNFAEVDTGQRVQLRFDAYPYREAGYVEGTVSYVSNVASDGVFPATIRLDHGLVTNRKIPIPYRNGLKAQAIIIIKNTRLMNRLWYNIRKPLSAEN